MHNFYGSNIFDTLRIHTKNRRLFNEWIKIVVANIFSAYSNGLSCPHDGMYTFCFGVHCLLLIEHK